eukprot:1153492-Pelagomonas_calceolata.AAC.2
MAFKDCGAVNLLLRVHTLTVETASWEDGISPVCDRCSCEKIQDEANVLFMCRYEGLCAPGRPFLQHQLSVQAVSNFLVQRNKRLFCVMFEVLDLLLAGMDQPQADQPNSLAEDLPAQFNLILSNLPV